MGPFERLEAEPTSASSYSKPCGRSMRARCSAPETGLTMGRPCSSKTPSTRTSPRRASTSTSKWIGVNTGSKAFSSVDANTENIVANGSVSCPVMIFRTASRCCGVAAESTIGRQRPLPSWMGPGQLNTTPIFTPDRSVDP
jgi:hypothetical protein